MVDWRTSNIILLVLLVMSSALVAAGIAQFDEIRTGLVSSVGGLAQFRLGGSVAPVASPSPTPQVNGARIEKKDSLVPRFPVVHISTTEPKTFAPQPSLQPQETR